MEFSEFQVLLTFLVCVCVLVCMMYEEKFAVFTSALKNVYTLYASTLLNEEQVQNDEGRSQAIYVPAYLIFNGLQLSKCQQTSLKI